VLKVHAILRSFYCIFRGNCVLYAVIYAHILVLCLGMFLWSLLQDFSPFDSAIALHLSAYWPPLRHPKSYNVEGRKSRRMSIQ